MGRNTSHVTNLLAESGVSNLGRKPRGANGDVFVKQRHTSHEMAARARTVSLSTSAR